ncbi:hypothetical protein ACQEUX_03170 [Micromonospora sp. CA-259024]|uniref:hypothetical protein n=1 Tax=Micromonospora sp. CA-259024 TaxID=3239965 RepID=UPI003D8E6457
MDITGGEGVRLAFDPIAGPGVETLAQGIAADGFLVVYGALDPRRTPLPNAQSYPALNSSTYTLFETTMNPERLRRAVAFVNAGLASGSLTPVIPGPAGPARTAGRGRARRGEWSSAPGRGIGWGQPAAQVAVAPGPVPVPWKPKLVDCRAPTCPL